jgi:hypothetical protein
MDIFATFFSEMVKRPLISAWTLDIPAVCQDGTGGWRVPLELQRQAVEHSQGVVAHMVDMDGS